jgi:hypothetical protein
MAFQCQLATALGVTKAPQPSGHGTHGRNPRACGPCQHGAKRRGAWGPDRRKALSRWQGMSLPPLCCPNLGGQGPLPANSPANLEGAAHMGVHPGGGTHRGRTAINALSSGRAAKLYCPVPCPERLAHMAGRPCRFMAHAKRGAGGDGHTCNGRRHDRCRGSCWRTGSGTELWRHCLFALNRGKRLVV